MINRFDPENYPIIEPKELAAGERWAWKRPDITTAYPPASYTLEYRLSIQESNHKTETFQAVKSDGQHVIELSSSTTNDYSAGVYFWQAVVLRDSDAEEVVVNTGYIDVKHDIGGHVGDTRSFVYTTLTNIRATIQKTATKEQKSHEVEGRKLERRSPAELLELEKEFSKRWANYVDSMDIKNGRQKRKKGVITQLSGR